MTVTIGHMTSYAPFKKQKLILTLTYFKTVAYHYQLGNSINFPNNQVSN